MRALRQLHRAARRRRGSGDERDRGARATAAPGRDGRPTADVADRDEDRSEEHTPEPQSPCNLVCRLLLEKKKTLLLIWLPLRSSHTSRSIYNIFSYSAITPIHISDHVFSSLWYRHSSQIRSPHVYWLPRS